MIFSGKFKKGQRLLREEIAQLFKVSGDGSSHSVFTAEGRWADNY